MAIRYAREKTGVPVVLLNEYEYENSSAVYTIAGSTSNPTTGSGATFYRNTYRQGRWATIRYEFSQLAAGTAGSGDYLLPIPTGLNIDYTRAGVLSTSESNGNVGDGRLSNGTTDYEAIAFVSNSGVYANKIAVKLTNDAVPLSGWGSSVSPLSNSVLRFSITIRVPISNWIVDEFVAYGAGLATASRPGLVGNRTPIMNLAPYVTADSSPTAVICRGYAYADVNGVWKLNFNLYMAVPPAARGGTVITFSGLQFRALMYQAVSAVVHAGNILPTAPQALTAPAGGSSITVSHQSASTTEYTVSGDVELTSKPTWA